MEYLEDGSNLALQILITIKHILNTSYEKV
jgi:hypothetical protein